MSTEDIIIWGGLPEARQSGVDRGAVREGSGKTLLGVVIPDGEAIEGSGVAPRQVGIASPPSNPRVATNRALSASVACDGSVKKTLRSPPVGLD